MTVMRSGDPAPDVELIASNGTPVPTRELWSGAPVLILFGRHFGCPCWTATLGRVREAHPRIEEAGARVAAVFMGSPSTVDRYRAERALPFGCYADPDRSAYRAFGLDNAGPRAWLASRAVLAGTVRALGKGVRVGLPYPGQDVRQLAGSFVVSATGRVRVAHYQRHAADEPPVDVLLDALWAG